MLDEGGMDEDWTMLIVTTATVLSVAKGVATCSTQGTADECAFEATMTLRADDATDGSAAETADHSSLLSTRSGSAG